MFHHWLFLDFPKALYPRRNVITGQCFSQ